MLAVRRPLCEAAAAEEARRGRQGDFIKKCEKDGAGGSADAGSAACEKSAADKKLAGAAGQTATSKCMADAAASAPK